MKLPKALQGKKPEDIRAMNIPELAKLFSEGDAPTVDDLKGVFQDGDLAAIAAALGLGEEATIEDIVAAIQALVEKAAAAMPEGEMGKELQKANERIAALEGTLAGQTALAAWKEKTATFTAIPGTPTEHATKLAAIEAKAGIEAAEAQFATLEEANKLAVAAQEVIGTTRTAGPTDFDNEVTKYMSEHSDASKVDAIKAVSKARPDLYFARRS